MTKVLVVDDSAFMRQVITDILKKMPTISAVHSAQNGQKCLEVLHKRKDFDLILMDIEMPVMDGLSALKLIKKKYSIPVVVLSALSDQAVTIKALEYGAADFIEKPVNLMEIKDEWIKELHVKIKNICGKSRTKNVMSVRENYKLEVSVKKFPRFLSKPAAVVIGASTGGPKALLEIVKGVRYTNIPIFIVQHMPAGFTSSFSERLNEECGASVVEARDNMVIENQVYLCPGDYHMTVQGERIKLDQRPKMHGTRPAIDHLFETAAKQYGPKLTAFILTGMGHDGTAGAQMIAASGGYVIAEDQESCIVFGMPHSAIKAQVVDEVANLHEISKKLKKIVG